MNMRVLDAVRKTPYADAVKNMYFDDMRGFVCFIPSVIIGEVMIIMYSNTISVRHTREQIEQELETVLELIDTGHTPILITADGKPDLLMFSWSDYKRRFSILYPPGELERVEEEMQRQKETQ